MAVKIDSVKVDTDREANGAWMDSTAYPGVRYLVRGLSYQGFEIANGLALQRMAKAYKTNPVPSKVKSASLGKIVGEHLLLGWEGFDEPYDRAGAVEKLSDPAYRNLLDDVLRACAMVAERDLEFIEGLEKN